jgi:hypothetical protein
MKQRKQIVLMTLPKKLRLIFAISPLAIILIYFGISGIIELPRENQLVKHTGEIEYYKVKNVYYKYLKEHEQSYVIKIKTVDTLFVAQLIMYGDTLKKYLPVAKTLEIWNYPQSGWKEVVKMKINDLIIIKYNDGSPILFFIPLTIGLVLIVLSIHHIIKHQEEYFG